MKHGLNRRNFIKGTAVAIDGLIGTLIGIPSIAYLLSSLLDVEKNSDLINLGPLEKYPLGIPTRFDAIFQTTAYGSE